jgi:hypothetical protein
MKHPRTSDETTILREQWVPWHKFYHLIPWNGERNL